MADSRLVYSTSTTNTCARCHKPLKKCSCQRNGVAKQLANTAAKTVSGLPQDGIVRISRETKGRKGKGVTLITGVALSEAELKALATQLKSLCGAGGSLKDKVIEIQGDHRAQIQAFLEQHLQQKTKLAGG